MAPPTTIAPVVYQILGPSAPPKWIQALNVTLFIFNFIFNRILPRLLMLTDVFAWVASAVGPNDDREARFMARAALEITQYWTVFDLAHTGVILIHTKCPAEDVFPGLPFAVRAVLWLLLGFLTGILWSLWVYVVLYGITIEEDFYWNPRPLVLREWRWVHPFLLTRRYFANERLPDQEYRWAE